MISLLLCFNLKICILHVIAVAIASKGQIEMAYVSEALKRPTCDETIKFLLVGIYYFLLTHETLVSRLAF